MNNIMCSVKDLIIVDDIFDEELFWTKIITKTKLLSPGVVSNTKCKTAYPTLNLLYL